MVVVHGLGSRASNHADFAARCAVRGWAALAVDLRGHGASPDGPGDGMLDDVLAGVDHLAAAGHGAIGVRGSSLGGFLALHAASRTPRVRAVVAICPARPESVAARIGNDWPLALPALPGATGPDGVARGYWHATGDEQVPWGGTASLAARTPHPMRLRVALGGTHRSLQHDPAVQAETVAFLADHLDAP